MLSPEIELAFGDGDYLFALPLPQLVELEEKCGFIDAQGNRRKRGVIAIYSDLLAGLVVIDGEVVALPHEGRASGADSREIVRLGLIGGGKGLVNGKSIPVDALLARKLVERHIDTAPLVKRWTTAAAILRAAIEGYEPPKKAQPAKEPAAKRARKPRSTSEA